MSNWEQRETAANRRLAKHAEHSATEGGPGKIRCWKHNLLLKAESDQEIQGSGQVLAGEDMRNVALGNKPRKVTAQMLTEQIQARRAVRAGKASLLAAKTWWSSKCSRPSTSRR